MKPSLNPESEDAGAAEDRRLQVLLRDSAPDYIDDAGFTSAVLQRLPASRPRYARRRLWLVGAALVLGSASAAALAGPAVVDQGGPVWDWVLGCCTRPVPYLGETVSIGSLLAGLAAAGLGWRAYRRES